MVFDDEPTTVALMDAYLEKNGYVNGMNMERLHHEIYAWCKKGCYGKMEYGY